MTPHLFLRVPDDVDECCVCGLPEVNKCHNAREIKINKRTRREEYV